MSVRYVKPLVVDWYENYLKIHTESNLTEVFLFDSGGTVDITVHEVMEDAKLKELHKASGGAWGGTKVDEAFRQFIIKLVGKELLLSYHFLLSVG
jgi:hypothetical protein